MEICHRTKRQHQISCLNWEFSRPVSGISGRPCRTFRSYFKLHKRERHIHVSRIWLRIKKSEDINFMENDWTREGRIKKSLTRISRKTTQNNWTTFHSLLFGR